MSKLFRVVAACAAVWLLASGRVEAAQSEKTPQQKVMEAPQVQADAQARLRSHLVTLGLTVEEAEAKISALTPTDLQKLGSNLDQVRMAGVKDSTLILIAVILILPGLIVLMAL